MPTLVTPGPAFTPISLDDCGSYVLSHTHEGVRVMHDMDTSHINVVHGHLCGARVVVDPECDEATWAEWTTPHSELPPPRNRVPSSLHVATGSVSKRSRRTKEEEPEPVEEVVCEDEDDEDEDEETAFDDEEDKDVDTIIE